MLCKVPSTYLYSALRNVGFNKIYFDLAINLTVSVILCFQTLHAVLNIFGHVCEFS